MEKANKKISITRIICFLFVIILSGSENSYPQNSLNSNESISNPFIISLALDKKEFIEGESVWLTVTFMNNGNSVDSLKILNSFEVYSNLKITNNNGQTSPFRGGIQDYISYSYTKFNPGQDKTFYFELQICCGFLEIDNIKGDYYYFPNGIYKVIAYFDYENSTKIEKIRSEEIKFIVKKPTINEQKEFDLLQEAYRLPSTNKINDQEKKVNAFNKFIQLYPESKYMEIALNHSSIIKNVSDMGYDSTFIKQVDNFLENNPQSHLSEALIYYSADIITKKYGGTESAVTYLEEMKNRYPDTRISKGADHLLKTNMYTKSEKDN